MASMLVFSGDVLLIQYNIYTYITNYDYRHDYTCYFILHFFYVVHMIGFNFQFPSFVACDSILVDEFV